MNPHQNTPDYGKIPPQSRELEEIVLGAILLEKDAIHEAIEIIRTPDVFYINAHGLIWKAMVSIYHENGQIDSITVSERLKKQGKLDEIGGAYYLIQICSKIGSSANITQHCRLLTEKYILRKIITIGNMAITQAYNDTSDAIELLGAITGQFDYLNMELNGQGEKSWNVSVIEEVDSMRAAAERERIS